MVWGSAGGEGVCIRVNQHKVEVGDDGTDSVILNEKTDGVRHEERSISEGELCFRL